MSNEELIALAVAHWRYLGVMIAAYALTQFVPKTWSSFKDSWLGEKMPRRLIGFFEWLLGPENKRMAPMFWCVLGVHYMPMSEGCSPLGTYSVVLLGIVLGFVTAHSHSIFKWGLGLVSARFFPNADAGELQKRIDELLNEHRESTRNLKAPTRMQTLINAAEKTLT